MLVELEKSGQIGILRLRRPERANALNQALLQSVENLQNSLRTDSSVQVLITTGEGKGFSAGSDLEEIAGMSPAEAADSQLLEARVGRTFLALPQLTIAAIHGYALGGGLFLAAYHDFRIVTSNARLGLPEVKLGWNPTFGIQRLIQLVGPASALEWLMSGEEFSAAEAHQRGLVTSVVSSAENVLTTALQLAERFSQLPPAGLAAIKKALWHENGSKWEQSDTFEARLFEQCLSTNEAQASLRRYGKSRSNKGSK